MLCACNAQPGCADNVRLTGEQMKITNTKLAVTQMTFSLYDRPVHPELFNIFARQRLITERYDVLIWATGCSHVLNIFAGQATLVEILSLPNQLLPRHGLVKKFDLSTQQKHTCSHNASFSYLSRMTVKKMSPKLYEQSHTDLNRFARNRGVFVTFPKLAVKNLEPFTYIDFEARKDQLYVHTFHAYPRDRTIIRIQSQIGF